MTEMALMSSADRDEWRALREWRAHRLAEPAEAPGWWARTAGRVAGDVRTVVEYVPGAVEAGRLAVSGLGRLIDAGTGTAAASVRTGPIVAAHRERGHPVAELSDLRDLPLADLRAVTPDLGVPYAIGGAVQGAGSSLVTSSGTVLAAGTGGVAAAPGLGAVLAVLGVDAALGVLVSTRAVAHVAAYHGYDVADPDERLFALGVLSLGLAEDSRRAAAYRELAGVARGLARRQAVRLTSERVGAVVRTVSTSLALRLTQERFAQVVPLLGTALVIRRTVRSLRQVVDDAEHLYAERLLRERYDVPFEEPGPDDEPGEIAAALRA
ncbi:EcsC family protein [Actinomycetospora sp. OC33-EN08]|uniref:EcsC family protein n=1 Tax=Actinomycetospora aurantiaca TaxID=3129233 RepID=A0ABU8MVH0_9PSEU